MSRKKLVILSPVLLLCLLLAIFLPMSSKDKAENSP